MKNPIQNLLLAATFAISSALISCAGGGSAAGPGNAAVGHDQAGAITDFAVGGGVGEDNFTGDGFGDGSGTGDSGIPNLAKGPGGVVNQADPHGGGHPDPQTSVETDGGRIMIWALKDGCLTLAGRKIKFKVEAAFIPAKPKVGSRTIRVVIDGTHYINVKTAEQPDGFGQYRFKFDATSEPQLDWKFYRIPSDTMQAMIFDQILVCTPETCGLPEEKVLDWVLWGGTAYSPTNPDLSQFPLCSGTPKNFMPQAELVD